MTPVPGSDLIVHFIDVGQGDSMLVQSGGKNMLIDAGTLDSGSTVTSYLKEHGVSTIDVLVSTHPHSDHIGGMAEVLNAFPVKVIYDSGVPHTTQTYERYLTLIDQKDIKYVVPEPGDMIDFAPGVVVQVLAVAGNYEDLNDRAIVLRLTHGGVSFLFMADAGFDVEGDLLKSGYNLQSDVLKVGHHASKYSSGTSFLKVVQPKIAVIEVGAGNPYGHPTREAMNRLEAAGATIYRTDYDGDVVVTSDGKGITVVAERRAPA
ncbi:ComEC/Rec2 family competence protein [Methanocella arvoryzae]|uniref:ComEC/Rec2 family competence protein n=1 Tax=Methanocella arvoryzae TaxID=1175445 RepID=UPI000323AD45|nr:MBL fold metallo-hydrolase [Methanocella arvoryzae]